MDRLVDSTGMLFMAMTFCRAISVAYHVTRKQALQNPHQD
jgi:hypothetical protein